MTVDEFVEKSFPHEPIEVDFHGLDKALRDTLENLVRLAYEEGYKQGQREWGAALAEDYGDGCLID